MGAFFNIYYRTKSFKNQQAMNKLFTLLLLLLTLPILGQDRCATDILLEQQLQDPKFKRSYQKLEKLAKKAEDVKRASNMPDMHC